MRDATFLLLINLAIGVTFAAAFLALSQRSAQWLGRSCALAFLCAAGTVSVEALAPEIGSVRLVSTLSYGLLMAALTLIALGLLHHHRPGADGRPLLILGLLAVLFNATIGVGLVRGTWIAALAYQGPFAGMSAAAAAIVLRHSPRRTVDWAVAAVLIISAVQFAGKGLLIASFGADIGVRAYLASDYARYSQTAGSLISLALGVSLLALVATEMMAETVRRFERDALSAALGRVAFHDRAPCLLARAAPLTPLAIAMCDLDHFKSINDIHGHAAGDEVIRDVGRILISYSGSEGLCGRIGGDEFCLIVPLAPSQRIELLAERIALDVAALVYDWLPPNRSITVSLGLARIARPTDLADALKQADAALYQAKRAGRAQSHVVPEPA